VRYFEHCSRTLDSIKGREFLDHLIEYLLGFSKASYNYLVHWISNICVREFSLS